MSPAPNSKRIKLFKRTKALNFLSVLLSGSNKSWQWRQLQLPLKCSLDDHLPFGWCPVYPIESVEGWRPNSLVCQLWPHTCWFCLSGYISCQICTDVRSVLILPSRRTPSNFELAIRWGRVTDYWVYNSKPNVQISVFFIIPSVYDSFSCNYFSI